MASRREITTFAEYIAEKRECLSKLRDLYEEELELELVAFNSKDEERILNAQYVKLLAEIEVMEDFQVNSLPEDPDFLYEWTKHKLKIKIEDYKKSLKEQANTHEQLIADEKELLKKLEKDKHNEDNDQTEELLDDEKYFAEVVQQIHRKLVKRLRRLARGYLSSDTSTSSSEMNSQKSFCKVLQKFIPELQHPPAADLSEELVVVVDESTPKEHLQFLLDSNVIEVVDKDPLTLCLKKTI